MLAIAQISTVRTSSCVKKGQTGRSSFSTPVFCFLRFADLANLGRNILRNNFQKRFDVSLAKHTRLKEQLGVEFRWEVFNAFNNVNFATPGNDLQDSTDFGRVLNTIGGSCVMQFGLRFVF